MGTPTDVTPPPTCSGELDYYGVLGLKADATDEDVRRAYRSLALTSHPDKCSSINATDTFKAINKAYDVLSNPVKRTAYDLHGASGLHELEVDENTANLAEQANLDTNTSSSDSAGFRDKPSKISPKDARAMFERLFGSRHLSGMFAGARNQEDESYIDATCRPQNTFAPSHRAAQHVDEPVEQQLKVTLEELEVGTLKRFKVVNPDGSAEVLQLEVKAGWTHGTRILFPGKGGRSKHPGAPPRDLVFVVHQLEHHVYRREQSNLVVDLEVPLVTALCGGNVTIPQFGSRPAMQVPISPGIQIGSIMMIPGRGLPDPNGGPPGNLKVCLKIVLPRDLSQNQMDQLRAILSPQQ